MKGLEREKRGLLGCPIIGVAVSDWSDDDLREHARTAIVNTGEKLDEKVFERFAARLSYVSGDFDDDQTYQRVKTAVGDARARHTGVEQMALGLDVDDPGVGVQARSDPRRAGRAGGDRGCG